MKMKTKIKILLLCGVLFSMAFSCEKEKEEILPSNLAKGKIVMKFVQCYGAWVMIEVENPKGIGKSGTFIPIGLSVSKFDYTNAIGVPYFSRIPGLKTEAPDTIGTWLYFEYRELTDEERHSNIFFDTSLHHPCPMNIVSPSVSYYNITKIIDYH